MAYLLIIYQMPYRNPQGQFKLEVVTTLPDSAYFASTTQSKLFTGAVLVENWSGELLKSINYTNEGIFVYDSQAEHRGTSLKMKTPNDLCPIFTDWYTCSSNDGGESWFCSYQETTVYYVECAGSGGNITDEQHETIYNYPPNTGSGGTGSIEPDEPTDTIPDNPVDTCPEGYVKDANGDCIKINKPCNEDDTIDDAIIKHQNIQDAFVGLWTGSNAASIDAPMTDRREHGGWIVDNNDSYEFIPFPDTWIRSACGIAPPANWANDIPPNIVGMVHTHPFYKGEDRRPACGYEGAEAAYVGGPSGPDYIFLLELMNHAGKFDLKSYVIDGNTVSSIGFSGFSSLKKYDRCGY